MLGFVHGFSAFATRRGRRQSMLATGGTTTVTAEGGRFFRVHRFDASGSLNVLRPGRVECVIVGGGGGGGFRLGGGGGAGGVWKFVEGEADNNLENIVELVQGTIAIIVGAGGSGGVEGAMRGMTGTSSSAFGIIAQGGAGGGGNQFGVLNGASGASGGGAVLHRHQHDRMVVRTSHHKAIPVGQSQPVLEPPPACRREAAGSGAPEATAYRAIPRLHLKGAAARV